MPPNPFIDSFTNSIDVEGLRIAKFTDIIFFCGGPWDIESTTNFQSARDFLLVKISASDPKLFDRFYYEANMEKWLEGGHFSDLHTFERHISEISSVVFLIAESPGSFSELGSFVSEETIVKKLFVVTNTSMDNDETYISLGPIRLLREIDEKEEKNVRSYAWGSSFKSGDNPNVTKDDLEKIWCDIIESLCNFEASIKSEKIFNKNICGHVSILILDLVDLYGACKLGEIYDFLLKLKILDTMSALKRHIFLLTRVSLLKSVRHGGVYFVANTKSSFIAHAFTPHSDSLIRDRLRLKQKVRAWFKENDRGRFEVIRRHATGAGDE